jgi:hypothetical protein
MLRFEKEMPKKDHLATVDRNLVWKREKYSTMRGTVAIVLLF